MTHAADTYWDDFQAHALSVLLARPLSPVPTFPPSALTIALMRAANVDALGVAYDTYNPKGT